MLNKDNLHKLNYVRAKFLAICSFLLCGVFALIYILQLKIWFLSSISIDLLISIFIYIFCLNSIYNYYPKIISSIITPIFYAQTFFLIIEPYILLVFPVENPVLKVIQYFFFFSTIINGIATFSVSIQENNNQTNSKTSIIQKYYKFFIILTFIGYLITRIALPILHTGSYNDEYLHVYAGISFLTTGHFVQEINIDTGTYGPYVRGAYVSILVGALLLSFGKSIFVAKLVPICVGLINFFLVFKITNILEFKKKNILLVLFLYILTPLIIFNDFYIRMYVFYEFFTLCNIYLFSQSIKYYLDNNGRRSLIYLTLGIFINGINFFLSNDDAAYFPLLIGAIYLIYIFLKFNIASKWVPTQINKVYIRLSILGIFSFLLIYMLHLPQKLNLLFSNTIAAQANSTLLYNNLFFNVYPFYTVLFLLSIYLIFFEKSIYRKLFIISVNLLFILHIASSPSIQVSRVIAYFMPLFLIGAIYTYEFVGRDNILKGFLTTAIVFTAIINPNLINFYQTPNLPSEVLYIDYAKIASYLKDDCLDKTIYVLDPTWENNLTKFYGIKVDYVPYLASTLPAQNPGFRSLTNGTLLTNDGETTVLTNRNYFDTAINSKFCLLVSDQYNFAWRYIPKSAFDYLQQNINKISFPNANLYHQ